MSRLIKLDSLSRLKGFDDDQSGRVCVMVLVMGCLPCSPSLSHSAPSLASPSFVLLLSHARRPHTSTEHQAQPEGVSSASHHHPLARALLVGERPRRASGRPRSPVISDAGSDERRGRGGCARRGSTAAHDRWSVLFSRPRSRSCPRSSPGNSLRNDRPG